MFDKRIKGTWFEFFHHSKVEGQYWNPKCRSFTEDDWRNLLRRIAGEGNTAALVGTDARMVAFADRAITLETHAGQPLGVFSLSELSAGVTIEGAAYALENGTLHFDFPHGVSNTAKGNEVKISAKKGTLLVVLSK